MEKQNSVLTEKPSARKSISKVWLIVLICFFCGLFLISLIIAGYLLITRNNEEKDGTNTHEQLCEYHGQTYHNGDTFDAEDDCNTCFCDNGNVVCTEKACVNTDDYEGWNYKELEKCKVAFYYPKEWYFHDNLDKYQCGNISLDEDRPVIEGINLPLFIGFGNFDWVESEYGSPENYYTGLKDSPGVEMNISKKIVNNKECLYVDYTDEYNSNYKYLYYQIGERHYHILWTGLEADKYEDQMNKLIDSFEYLQ